MSYVIEHEHQVQDEIYFMHKNKVTEGKVEEIQIAIKKSQFAGSVHKTLYSIIYVEEGSNVNSMILKPSEFVFATKQELLDSL